MEHTAKLQNTGPLIYMIMTSIVFNVSFYSVMCRSYVCGQF